MLLNEIENLPDLSTATEEEAARFILAFLKEKIPFSSTKLSLNPEGYPAYGEIEVKIRENQRDFPLPLDAAVAALKSQCGNCQELAYAGALILRAAGYQGEIAIGQYGINHQFLFIDNLIVDPWAEVVCARTDWKGSINAYGGSVKDGLMRGRIVAHDAIELEDEEPEIVEIIPKDYILKHISNNNLKNNFRLFFETTDNDMIKTNMMRLIDKAPKLK